MVEQKAEERAKPENPWTEKAFLGRLRGKPVQLVLASGERSLKGTLLGYDSYQLFLRLEDGPELMVAKHAVALVRPLAGKEPRQ